MPIYRERDRNIICLVGDNDYKGRKNRGFYLTDGYFTNFIISNDKYEKIKTLIIKNNKYTFNGFFKLNENTLIYRSQCGMRFISNLPDGTLLIYPIHSQTSTSEERKRYRSICNNYNRPKSIKIYSK